MKLALFTLVVLAACSDRPADEDTETSPSGQLTGERPAHMRNCPSAVTGATTRATPTPDGVDVEITAPDPTAAKRIAELARLQASLTGPLLFPPYHSARHGGPGTIGYCPIIHQGTTVSAQALDNGARIHVAARSPYAIKMLQVETQKRIRSLPIPNT
jgi:hypothetical protein